MASSHNVKPTSHLTVPRTTPASRLPSENCSGSQVNSWQDPSTSRVFRRAPDKVALVPGSENHPFTWLHKVSRACRSQRSVVERRGVDHCGVHPAVAESVLTGMAAVIIPEANTAPPPPHTPTTLRPVMTDAGVIRGGAGALRPGSWPLHWLLLSPCRPA